MLITVDRIISDDDTTVSTIAVDGRFLCFGLEDEFREEMIVSETRIPAGRFKVGVGETGGSLARYKKKLPDMLRGMPHVLDVSGFEFNPDPYRQHGCGHRRLSARGHRRGRPAGRHAHSIKHRGLQALYPMVIGPAQPGDLKNVYVDSDR